MGKRHRRKTRADSQTGLHSVVRDVIEAILDLLPKGYESVMRGKCSFAKGCRKVRFIPVAKPGIALRVFGPGIRQDLFLLVENTKAMIMGIVDRLRAKRFEVYLAT